MATKLKPNERHAIAVVILLIIIAILVARLKDQEASQKSTTQAEAEYDQRADSSQLAIAEFDPNTVELPQLLEMGLTKYEALSILRYRASGKIFHIKEELIGCWGISDSLYFALEPYIVIGEEYQYKSRTDSSSRYVVRESSKAQYPTPQPFTLDTVTAEYIQSHGLLSLRQAEVMLRWHATSHIANIDELRECYVVSDSAALKMAQYIIFTPDPRDQKETTQSDTTKLSTSTQPATPEFPINLNTADSATLRAIHGVGEKSVMAIIQRRTELGGFHSVHQLREVDVILKSNFEKIISQIFIDSCDISKIDINFAPATELSAHPYFNKKQVRRILHLRQLKGGWSNIEIMIEDKIFTQEEALKVRPYLDFVLPN